MERFFSELIIFHYDFLFIIAGLLLLLCMFILARRLIEWGKERDYFLAFIVGSSFFLNLFFFILVIGKKEGHAVIFLPYLLQIIGIYGLLLLLGLGCKFVFKRIVRKRV